MLAIGHGGGEQRIHTIASFWHPVRDATPLPGIRHPTDRLAMPAAEHGRGS